MKISDYGYDFVEFLCEDETDIFTLLRSNNLSERFIKDIYYNKLIRINSKLPGPNGILKKGDKLRIYYREENAGYEILDAHIDVIYEDENYLLVNKPANIVVHPTFSNRKGSFLEEIGSYFKKNDIRRRVRLVNRLDLETSGLLLVSKNPLFQQQISLSLSNGEVEKKYVALVQGKIEGSGIIDKRISQDPNFTVKRIIDKNGQNAITRYNPLRVSENCSLVELTPITGRTHQLRVHLKSIGHSILGDKLYGSPSRLIKRCALHSKSIKFLDPFTNAERFFEIGLPKDMNDCISTLF